MKRFLLKVSLLLVIIVLADFLIGNGLGYIVNSIKVGGQGRDNYIANEVIEDILVFGSSRAVHHYNTPMIEDSLGLTAYNCGEDGAGIILSYGRLMMIIERHSPQIILYDVNGDFDLLKNDNHKYLGKLKTHYQKAGIRDVFISVDKTEQFKMMSRLYRYNSVFLQNVVVFLTGKSHSSGEKGYRPMEGELDKMKINLESTPVNSYDYDSLKIDYLNRFIDLAGDAKLIFVVSPVWYGMDTEQIAPLKEICKKRNIPLLDYSNDPKYVHNDYYFIDGMHLNSIGADEFTRDLLRVLKSE